MRLRTTLISAIAIGLLAGSAVGASAQESEVATADDSSVVMSPGPLGRSYASWGGEWLEWWLSNLPNGPEVDCALGDRGPVFFAPGQPGSEVDCMIRADQHILLTVGSSVCWSDEALYARANPGLDAEISEARNKRLKKLQRQVLRDRASAYDCMTAAQSDFEVSLKLDGDPILIDEADFTLTIPFELRKSDDIPLRDFFPERGKYIAAGYFVMLAPLDPGHHSIEAEVVFTDGTTPPGFKYVVNAEIVEATAG